MKTSRCLAGASLLFLAVSARPVSADWLITPYIGASFGGDVEGEHLTYGGSIGYMGARVIGFEVDLGYSPEFLEGDDDDIDFVGDANVTTLMANVIVGVPIGQTTGARLYASGGAGLLRTRVDDADDLFDVDDNAFGVNVGGGVIAFPSEHVGIRADIRYFRKLDGDSDELDDFDFSFGDFNFWRGTVGVSFRF